MVDNEILNTNSAILRIQDTNLTNAMLQGYLFLGISTIMRFVEIYQTSKEF